MARQDSFIKLKGRIGDLTFYKSNGSYLAREKGGVEASRIATDPKFQRTRENGAEFGRAGRASKLFRDSLTQLIGSSKDSAMSNRLTKLMLKVVQADAVNGRGERMVLDAETELLRGFEFNTQAQVNTVIGIAYTSSIDRATGELKVDLPAFDPSVFLKSPQGATHFQLKAMGLALNFNSGDKVSDLVLEERMPLNLSTAAISLSCNVGVGSTDPLFLVFGIDFYQEVNGTPYALNNGMYNALCVVAALGV